MRTENETVRDVGGERAGFDVVGVGANSLDYTAVVPAHPGTWEQGAKMRLRRHARLSGGQTATALAACARFGLRTAYVGATGTDANGDLVRAALGRLDVDLTHLVVHEAFNQLAMILVDERTGERVVLWDRDERLNLRDEELPAALLTSARLVHVDDTDERAALAAAGLARARGIPVTSDIDHVTPRTEELAAAVSVAIFAEHVPLQLTGRPSVADALRAMPRRAGQVLCATLGGRGAVALDDDGWHAHAAFRVKVADTTAAGDVFRAGLIYGLLQGWTLDEQMRFANAAAAVSCTRLGAIASAPSLEEVRALLSGEGDR